MPAIYYDAYTVYRDKVARGDVPEDVCFERRAWGSAPDTTAWVIAIAAVIGLYLQNEQLRIMRRQEEER